MNWLVIALVLSRMSCSLGRSVHMKVLQPVFVGGCQCSSKQKHLWGLSKVSWGRSLPAGTRAWSCHFALFTRSCSHTFQVVVFEIEDSHIPSSSTENTTLEKEDEKKILSLSFIWGFAPSKCCKLNEDLQDK